jgi:hypothetical protein
MNVLQFNTHMYNLFKSGKNWDTKSNVLTKTFVHKIHDTAITYNTEMTIKLIHECVAIQYVHV